MRVLVMGGTQFNGLALVHELARTGHEVVILNRGQTQADLPLGVERVYADRTNEAQMRDVLGAVDVDAVVDVSAYLPSDVELMIDLFRGRIAHYVFISSTVIYAASDLLPITERHPVQLDTPQLAYGRNKLLCERILLRERTQADALAELLGGRQVLHPHHVDGAEEQQALQQTDTVLAELFLDLLVALVDEVLRVLDGLQTDELCPCNWEKGQPTLDV